MPKSKCRIIVFFVTFLREQYRDYLRAKLPSHCDKSTGNITISGSVTPSYTIYVLINLTGEHARQIKLQRGGKVTFGIAM